MIYSLTYLDEYGNEWEFETIAEDFSEAEEKLHMFIGTYDVIAIDMLRI